MSQGPGERNFHVFYYMFAGLDEAALRNNLLDRPENHRCVGRGGKGCGGEKGRRGGQERAPEKRRSVGRGGREVGRRGGGEGGEDEVAENHKSGPQRGRGGGGENVMGEGRVWKTEGIRG